MLDAGGTRYLGRMAFVHLVHIDKKNTIFKKHLIRSSLLQIWSTIKYRIYEKTPLWITPVEAFKQQNLIDWHKIRTYKDFVKKDGSLKSSQELEESNIK